MQIQKRVEQYNTFNITKCKSIHPLVWDHIKYNGDKNFFKFYCKAWIFSKDELEGSAPKVFGKNYINDVFHNAGGE